MVRRGRYHHGNLREALIEAALGLLEERAAHELSLREVARRAGVSHAAPYRHFDDREQLLAALAEHAFAELERRLHGADSVTAAARAYLDFALDHRARFRLMFDPIALQSALVRVALSRAVAPLSHSPLLWPALHGLATLAVERVLDCEPSNEALAVAMARALSD
jgi:AcrR family transcriptional regulator